MSRAKGEDLFLKAVIGSIPGGKPGTGRTGHEVSQRRRNSSQSTPVPVCGGYDSLVRPDYLPVLAMSIACAPAFAYTEPVEPAGPLTIKTTAPATGAYGAGGYVPLSRPGVPFTIPVYLRNASDQPVSGKLRVAVIDDRKIQSPDNVQFSVAPHEEAMYEFTITFGRVRIIYYPVHAYVDFDYRGQRLTAHPILIRETKIHDLPRPKLPVEWSPYRPGRWELGLWRLPVRRETAQVANTGAERASPGGTNSRRRSG